ncbi:MAG: hypothetical protein ACRYGG_12530, partial [Janthinobacterium lividum]
IVPPETLTDLHAFMHDHPDDFTFAPTTSHHQRMEMMARLHDLPDLARVVSGLGETHQMKITRDIDGRLAVKISPCRPA